MKIKRTGQDLALGGGGYELNSFLQYIYIYIHIFGLLRARCNPTTSPTAQVHKNEIFGDFM